MKTSTTIFGFLLLIISVSCSKTNPQDLPMQVPCNISANIDSNYRKDAKAMVFREILMDSTHVDRNNPILNSYEINLLLEKISAVYSLNIPERDSVFSKHKIHAFPIGLRQMHFQVDPNAPEIQNFINGLPTGDTTFDNLIQQYQIDSVRTALSYPDFNWLFVNTSVDLNLIPVADELEQLPYIYLAEYGGYPIGDGNNIYRSENNGITELDFSIAWGDCPAGCIYRKHWVFEVDQNCTATYKRVFVD